MNPSVVLLLLIVLLSAPAFAATGCRQCTGNTCEFLDTDFDPLDWTPDDLVLRVDAASAVFLLGQVSDADPMRGLTREVTHEISFRVDPSLLISGHVFTLGNVVCPDSEKVWDPAVDGAIDRISLLYEHRIVTVQNLASGGSQNGGVFPRVLLEQEISGGGVEYYVSDRLDQFRTTQQGFAWAFSGDVPDDNTNLVAADFQRVEPAGPGFGGQIFPGEHPDFSAAGGRIRVGFAAGTSTGDPDGRRSVFRIDDFRVSVEGAAVAVPALSLAGLGALGALLLGAGSAAVRQRWSG